ncbi:hypothetical protein TorRG33x02_356230, partial [Trema orientale]
MVMCSTSVVDPTQRNNGLYEIPHHLKMRRHQGESSGNNSQLLDKSDKLVKEEDQILRIDLYSVKEPVENLIIGPSDQDWQLTFSEDFGTEGHGLMK